MSRNVLLEQAPAGVGEVPSKHSADSCCARDLTHRRADSQVERFSKSQATGKREKFLVRQVQEETSSELRLTLKLCNWDALTHCESS